MKRMIKVISFLCALSTTLALASCKDSGKDNASVDVKNKVYNSTADYSGEQGYKNWYYLTARNSLEETEYMIWDSEMCTWRAKDINCLIEPNILHPAQLDQVIRAWKAPADGKITVKTNLQRRPVNKNGVGQDGCYAYIALSNDDILTEKIVEATDLEYHSLDATADIKKGEFIFFVLNCNGNYTFDQTYWDLTIEYVNN